MATDFNGAPGVGAAELGQEKQSRFQIPDHVRASHGTDGAAVLDTLHGQMFHLNYVASRILELLKQGSSEREISERLAIEFGIERPRAQADVREFLEILEKHHLVTSQEVS